MSDTKPELWHGIPRDEIPWRPTVDPEACIGCQLCYVTCGGGTCTRCRTGSPSR